jgi:serine/threonine-protein kinase
MLTVGMYLADRYEIIGKVGAGGMSDVYKAKDHILGRFVAIKVLKAEFSEDRNFVTKFRTEAQSAAGLEHPNIVNIYDVGSEEGLYYIVMEYVEGITLKTYIEKKTQLTFKETISIAIQVARGIEAAHNKNIIHRDIKPQNIIISTEGKVKVTDFGIARAASANTISSDVMGSVHYSSPEQARNGFVDNRSDIYSLGIVMYEMVTGRVPFDGDTTVAVAIQHLQEEMVTPSAYAQNLPVSLEKIILKCTQKNPDRRYQNMAELLNDLRKSLISPNEDFVVIAPLVDNGKTKVISNDELQQIKDGVSISATGDEDEQDTKNKENEWDINGEEDEDDEEDEDGILNPKMDKAVTIMGIVVAAIIVIVIVYFLGSLMGLFRFRKNTDSQTGSETQTETETETSSEEMVPMISILGMTQDEATEALNNIGLSLFVTDVVESDEEEGTILSQSIQEGESVLPGSYVEVSIAAGKTEQLITVTNVVGYAESDGISALTNQGLVVDKSYEYNEAVPAGQIITQTPTSGSTVTEGSTVKLVISQGVKSVPVPSVLGKDQTTAQNELTAAGLVVASVSQEYSDTVEAGNVISQSIAGGKTVEYGTEISLTVSLGAEVVYYSFSYALTVPEEATKADIVLTDSNGNVLCSWTKTAVDAGATYNISQSNISGGNSGNLAVTWYKTETDEEGNSSDVEISSQSNAVNFTKQ